jgi:hypothetical protein
LSLHLQGRVAPRQVLDFRIRGSLPPPRRGIMALRRRGSPRHRLYLVHGFPIPAFFVPISNEPLAITRCISV